MEYKVKVTNDLTGLVLPLFGLDGSVVGVKITSRQSVTVGDVERTRVVVKTVPR